MVKSSIFKYVQQNIKYITIYIYTHTHTHTHTRNLGYVEVLLENAINKVISSSVFYSLQLINTRSCNYSCTSC